MKKIIAISAIMCLAASFCMAQTPKPSVKDNDGATVVYIPFSTGEKPIWPFCEQRCSNKKAEPSCAGELTTYSLKCANSVDLEVFDTDGFTLNSITGFRFGGTAGDYINLPVVKGKKLKSITVVLGAAGNNGKPCIKDVKSGEVVKGGESWTESPTEAGEEYTWTLSGTKAKNQYQISFTYAKQIQMRSLEIVYE